MELAALGGRPAAMTDGVQSHLSEMSWTGFVLLCVYEVGQGEEISLECFLWFFLDLCFHYFEFKKKDSFLFYGQITDPLF